MDTKAAITSQFLAALEMMKQVVTKCPDDLWHNPTHTNKFWHIKVAPLSAEWRHGELW